MFCINMVYSLLTSTSLKLEEMHGMTWPWYVSQYLTLLGFWGTLGPLKRVPLKLWDGVLASLCVYICLWFLILSVTGTRVFFFLK